MFIEDTELNQMICNFFDYLKLKHPGQFAYKDLTFDVESLAKLTGFQTEYGWESGPTTPIYSDFLTQLKHLNLVESAGHKTFCLTAKGKESVIKVK